jgi:hypothetical protein
MFTFSTQNSGVLCCGLFILLTSCATPRGRNEAGGMIIGGISGGVLGH